MRKRPAAPTPCRRTTDPTTHARRVPHVRVWGVVRGVHQRTSCSDVCAMPGDGDEGRWVVVGGEDGATGERHFFTQQQ